jgi:magnesium transporter
MTNETVDRIDAEDALEELRPLLRDERIDQALALLGSLHPADQAEVIAELEADERAPLLGRLTTEALAEVIAYLDEEGRRDVAGALDTAVLGPVLDEVDRDVAVDVLHQLSAEQARDTLAAMTSAAEIAPLLPYRDDTAGGRMTTGFIALHKEWSVDDTLSYLRRMHPDAEQSYYLYVVDDAHRLEGVVSLRDLVVATPERRIAEIMAPEVVSVRTTDDQEEVARDVQRYNLVALPVVDETRRLVGVVSVDDLMDVAEEEATEDMYRMVGLGAEENVFSPVRVAARKRIPWLLVNLATAFLSALTVRAFEDTIASVAVLAAFMPVIAGHGGNTGTQTITLLVRGLALDEVGPGDALLVAWKEVRFGLIHGAITGMLAGGLAFGLTGNVWLAGVVFVAMLGNIIVAATVGSLLPLFMRRLGIDPALASAIWLTTFTDVLGFLLLLGLGTLLVDQIG